MRFMARFDTLPPAVRFVIAVLISLLLWGLVIAVVAGADLQWTAQD
jgi:hypothetical protein